MLELAELVSATAPEHLRRDVAAGMTEFAYITDAVATAPALPVEILTRIRDLLRVAA
jgi:hypothetical protein